MVCTYTSTIVPPVIKKSNLQGMSLFNPALALLTVFAQQETNQRNFILSEVLILGYSQRRRKGGKYGYRCFYFDILCFMAS